MINIYSKKQRKCHNSEQSDIIINRLVDITGDKLTILSKILFVT